MPPVAFTLDGAPVTVDADPKATALEVLRDTLGVLTAKQGCAPQGLCGCCTALIEGKPRLTCTLPARSLAGKAVTTVEGLPDDAREGLADAFVRAGGAQCGYCTPGILLSSHALLLSDPMPADEAIAKALNPHVCRCTGYTAILDAVRAAAAVRRGEPSPLPPVARPEGRDVALGDRPFVGDLVRPGMLHGALVFAPAATGTLETLDLAPAQALGALAVALLAPGEAIRHAGDAVAAVAAETPALARAAAAAVVVAFAADGPPTAPEAVATLRRVDGDVDAALAGCAHVVEATLRCSPTDPLFLEPEAALAVPLPDGILVYSPGHDAVAEAAAIADRVGAPARVLLVPSGGSYGGKEALGVQPAAALLARAAGRPVRVALTMEEGMRLHRRRPGATARVRAGCDAGGTLRALALDLALDGGADCEGADRILAQALGAFPYRCDVAVMEARVDRTGAPATGPIRGGGGVAATFAVEAAMDRLAAAAGIDPFDLRLKNLPAEGATVLRALEDAWRAAEGPRGVAVARADGSGGARVTLTVTGPDAVEVQCNVPELGQGRDETLLAALRASTGLPAAAFEIVWGDSAVVGPGAPAQSPVEGAARVAGAALAAAAREAGDAGSALAALVGRRFVGDDRGRAEPGWTAQVATLDAGGAVHDIRVAVGVGPGQDARLARNLAEGAAHMGTGIALSEEVEAKDGLPETRFRMLGALKPRSSPRIRGLAVRLEGGPRDVPEVAVMAAPAAIAGAVAALEGRPRDALPMKDSAAARAAGVRPPRPGA